MTLDAKCFGKNLSHIMKELGMTQSRLSILAGLTPAAISQLVNGERGPSIETVIKILGVIPTTFEKLTEKK